MRTPFTFFFQEIGGADEAIILSRLPLILSMVTNDLSPLKKGFHFMLSPPT